ncbi:recombinase family protein [Actinomadura scrupuli]|uniref:recombinase family protein n=1 Tax=Actinomadura scrupuli TaxID=559629 RepID=UPI003D95260B
MAHPVTSLVVKWIFAQYLPGRGTKDIAEELTRQGILSPSAADPERNRHHCPARHRGRGARLQNVSCDDSEPGSVVRQRPPTWPDHQDNVHWGRCDRPRRRALLRMRLLPRPRRSVQADRLESAAAVAPEDDLWGVRAQRLCTSFVTPTGAQRRHEGQRTVYRTETRFRAVTCRVPVHARVGRDMWAAQRQ